METLQEILVIPFKNILENYAKKNLFTRKLITQKQEIYAEFLHTHLSLFSSLHETFLLQRCTIL
jgi:hypothetical protein